MEPWKQRVIDDHIELVDRIDKLSAFLIQNKPGDGVLANSYDLLVHQRNAMISYRDALEARIYDMVQ